MAEPSLVEIELRREYHGAVRARDRLLVLHRWVIHLHQFRADTPGAEWHAYADRWHSIMKVAKAAIRYQQCILEAEKEGAVPTTTNDVSARSIPPVILTSGRDILVRVLEAIINAGVISPRSSVAQIVYVFFRDPHDSNAEAHYRMSRARIKRTKTSSPFMLRILQSLLDGCRRSLLGQVINYAIMLESQEGGEED